MPGLLVALEQLKLLGGGARRHFGGGQIGVEPGDPFLRAIGHEILGADANRHAGIAIRANRRVGDVVAPAKPAP